MNYFRKVVEYVMQYTPISSTANTYQQLLVQNLLQPMICFHVILTKKNQTEKSVS